MEQEQSSKINFPGELALLAALLLNSFAVTMIVKSNLGLSVISGVPYVLSVIWPVMSYGMWNMLIQIAWLVLLIVALRRLRPGYVLSFGLAVVFGYLLDFWALLFAPLPTTLVFRILYFAMGYVFMAFGIAFFVRCGLPILPFDTIPRELVLIKGLSLKQARTGFDLVNLVIMFALGLIFLGRLEGVGVGTVFNALMMGTGSGYALQLLDKNLAIEPRVQLLKKLA